MEPRTERGSAKRGIRVGRYALLQRIGRGGMGEVFLAFDPELDRKVALKLLRAMKRDEPKREQALAMRLVREAQSLAKLQHPNVVAVHDVGTVEGRVFIAMEYIEGSTLKQWSKVGRRWEEVIAPPRCRAAPGGTTRGRDRAARAFLGHSGDDRR